VNYDHHPCVLWPKPGYLIRAAFAVLLSIGISHQAAGQPDDADGIRVGMPVVEVVEEFRARGLPFAYSSTLLPAEILVLSKPSSQEPFAIVVEILQPHDLTVSVVEGLFVVTRLTPGVGTESRNTSVPVDVANDNVMTELIVSASRYEILRAAKGSSTFLTQRAIQKLPNFGQDPIRAVRRLPGTASGGASALPHIRGAESGDTRLILNGERLVDPFHFRDFQGIFSIIDARAVDGVEVFTGGFPVQYGDSVGGLLMIDTIVPDEDRRTEIGLSIFNTSFLSAGRLANGDTEWLLSARRSNLDLVLDDEFGRPLYTDLFTTLAFNVSSRTKISVNALFANDKVRIVAESDAVELDLSSNESRNSQIWINWTQSWTGSLSSSSGFSSSTIESSRVGLIDDPGKMFGQVADTRDFDIFAARQDWTLDVGEHHRLSWGADYRHLKGDYDYFGTVEYFGPFLSLEGLPASFVRDSRVEVEGDSFALYLSDRWRLTPKTVVDLGVRWDKQTYTDLQNETQFSPRFSLMHRLGTKTNLRLSLGRYYQSQGINELQVEDGVERFFPAQRSDTAIIGLQHRIGSRYAFRVEAYWKSLGRQRPRFENLFDPLAIIPELEPGRVRVLADRASSRGIETSVVYDNDGKFGWWASYTFAEATDQIDGRNVPKSWDQRHALQAGLDWTTDRWEVGMAANIRSGWPTTALSIEPSNDPMNPIIVFGARNADRFPTFATLDIRAAYTVPVRDGSLSFFLEISNALDRENPCCVDFDVDEDADGNLVLSQKDDFWLPLLPSIGVLWEF